MNPMSLVLISFCSALIPVRHQQTKAVVLGDGNRPAEFTKHCQIVQPPVIWRSSPKSMLVKTCLVVSYQTLLQEFSLSEFVGVNWHESWKFPLNLSRNCGSTFLPTGKKKKIVYNDRNKNGKSELSLSIINE